jgi:hypothetical protein
VESLADEDGSKSLSMSKENKAWESKKRKLLRATRRDEEDINVYKPISESDARQGQSDGGYAQKQVCKFENIYVSLWDVYGMFMLAHVMFVCYMYV